jgi:hypothetical protein
LPGNKQQKSSMTTRTLQDLFVDRQLQIERFRRSFDGGPRRIIAVTAGAGMGKSWLLKQFVAETRQRGGRAVLIDFSDGQAYDVLTLVRRCRDSFSSPHFNALTKAINEATATRVTLDGAGGGVNFSGAHIGDLQAGEIVGGNIIKDNFFIVQADNPVVLQAIEDRITLVFFECLRHLACETRVVFLFDSYERNSTDAERWVANAADRWITRELLVRLRDGALSNTLAVLAGRRLPELGIEWNAVLGPMPLELFTVTDVGHYLRENRGLAELSDAEVQTLFNAVQGNPQLLGIIGDNLEQTVRPKDSEDW